MTPDQALYPQTSKTQIQMKQIKEKTCIRSLIIHTFQLSCASQSISVTSNTFYLCTIYLVMIYYIWLWCTLKHTVY